VQPGRAISAALPEAARKAYIGAFFGSFFGWVNLAGFLMQLFLGLIV
jgi:hypothetical protein